MLHCLLGCVHIHVSTHYVQLVFPLFIYLFLCGYSFKCIRVRNSHLLLHS